MGRIGVRVTARAAADRIEGFDAGGSLRVRLAVPPVDGRANNALLRLLALALGLPVRDITLVAGASSRQKLVEIAWLDAEEIRERLSI